MNARTTARSIAGFLFGLTVLVGVVEPASATLDAGRVRVSSSNVLTADEHDDTTAVTTRKWDYIRI